MSSDRLIIVIWKEYTRRWFVAFIKSISRNVYTGEEQDHEDINITSHSAFTNMKATVRCMFSLTYLQYQIKNITSIISRSLVSPHNHWIIWHYQHPYDKCRRLFEHLDVYSIYNCFHSYINSALGNTPRMNVKVYSIVSANLAAAIFKVTGLGKERLEAIIV